MKRARVWAPLVATTIAACVASDASACSLAWRNLFTKVGEPPGAAELRAARYVDWVEIVAKGAPGCERDRAWTDEDLEAETAPIQPSTKPAGDPNAPAPDGVAIPAPPQLTVEGFESRSCGGQPRTGPVYALQARVLEPLKGDGPAIFPLAYTWQADGPPDRAYSDPRMARIEVEQGLPADYADATASHAEPGFNDHGELHTSLDQTDSCGGAPTAMIGGRYVAFRSARGAVLALEPVADASDPWFDRLRRLAADPKAFADPPLDIADFFRASTGLALVRVESCAKPGGKVGIGSIKVQTLRGKIVTNWWGEEDGADVPYWLPDYLQRIGASCRAGMTLLVMSGPFDEGEGSPPRAARVLDDGFRVKDLLSGYQLAGPDAVSVDQAFAWVEEGNRARAGGR